MILCGNLTRDPEVRYTAGGLAICQFGLAVNRSWKDAQGELKEEVTFVDVSAFGKQAETIGQYLKKGRPMLVEGRLKLDQWEDKQSGQKRSKLGVVLEAFTFLDSGKTEAGSSQTGNEGKQRDVKDHKDVRDLKGEEEAPGAGTGPTEEADDVPF